MWPAGSCGRLGRSAAAVRDPTNPDQFNPDCATRTLIITVGFASSAAAKYSSRAALRRCLGCPSAPPACSTPVGDDPARGSGRRGVDHIRAGGRFKDQSTVDWDSYARHLAFDAMAARSAAGGA
jgi:hypothetical protein